MLAALCLVRGITLAKAIERSRAASEQTAVALTKVHAAAELVSELRFASVEHAASRELSLKADWHRQRSELESLAQPGGVNFGELIARTTTLLEPPRKGAPPINRDASVVWAGWRRVEGQLTRRLMVELTSPGDQATSVALLAALGCLSCALLLWQIWHGGQLRHDAALVENTLRESDARSRAMAESAREILIQADPSGRILRSNHKERVGELAELAGGPEAWQEMLAAMSSTSEAAPGPPREIWLAGEDDGRMMEWRVWPVKDARGRLARVDSALLDVTAVYAARKAAESRTAELEQSVRKLRLQLKELLDQSLELAESRAVLKRTGEARMEGLLNWGRRVGQPLSEAMALSAKLRSGGALLHPDDAAALASAVGSVASSLRALADFAGLERGPLELAPGPLSPRGLLEDSVEAVAGRAEARHLEIPCFVHQNLPVEVTADARRLSEVLEHLLEHAIGHTTCGEVAVRLSVASRAGTVANLRFEIEDTGAGFSPEGLAAAFEPFHPGLASFEIASRFALAKRLVERMGGQFGGESERGQGTRVWFVVPSEVSAEANSQNPAGWAELRGRRILIVDDSASQRGALVELARTLGLEATAHASGEDALLHLESEARPYDFALLDDQIPGTRGVSVAGMIAADPALAASRVFLMVPYSARSSTREPGASEGCRVLSKPVRLSALAGLLLNLETASTEPSPPPRRERPSAARAGSPLVLIVEDNLVNQRVAVRLVEKMGYRTAVVNGGRDAIHAFQREQYDLILMDCQMPDVDGFTATAEIRRMETHGSRIPVIAMTANAMRGDREKCLAAGMDDYISKPVAYEDLRKLVTRWLARSEAARH